MKICQAENFSQLLEIVGDSMPNQNDPGSVAVEGMLWDGSVVLATYHQLPKSQQPDAETIHKFFRDLSPLIDLVQNLLLTRKTFITVTGSGDNVCCLKWSLADKSI